MFTFIHLFGRIAKPESPIQKMSKAIELKADEKGDVQLENIKKELTTAISIIKCKMITTKYIEKLGMDLNKLLKKHRLLPILDVSSDMTPDVFFPFEISNPLVPRKETMLETFEQCFPTLYSSLHQPKNLFELELETLFTELDKNLPPFSELVKDSGSGIASSHYFSFQSRDIAQNILDSTVEDLIANKSSIVNQAFESLYARVYANTLQQANLTSRKPAEQQALANLLGAIYKRKIDSARSSLQEITTTLVNNWSTQADAAVLSASDREKAKLLLTNALSLNAATYAADHFLLTSEPPRVRPGLAPGA